MLSVSAIALIQCYNQASFLLKFFSSSSSSLGVRGKSVISRDRIGERRESGSLAVLVDLGGGSWS
jgi:hypothetical protein